MAGPIYATSTEYQNSPYGSSPAPANISQLLAQASRAVDTLIVAAVYTVDNDQLPTDPDILAATRDATIAQARYSNARGDGEGTGETWSSVGIGSATLTRGSGSSAANTGGLSPRFSPVANDILRGAGLLPGIVFSTGRELDWWL